MGVALLVSASGCLAAFPQGDAASDTVGTGETVAEADFIPLNENGSFNGVNRFPLILADVKSLYAEAMIADQHGDSLEVIYLIEKIVELLTDAEQIGEMSEDDQEEYDRFEATLLYSYENHFITVDKTETPIAMASLKEELSQYLQPLEIEVNGSTFQVIDDRDGHIPLVLNSKVEGAIKFFQTRGKSSFENWLGRFPVYKDLILEILQENELPEELIYHAMVESGLNPKAYSRAHAAGMWQFISSTAKLYGLNRTWWIDERRDPVKSTEAAAKYMKDLFIEFDDWYLALAAYNAGAARVNRAIRLHQTQDFWQLHSLPRETRNHIPTFLATAILTRDPEKYGFKLRSAPPLKFDEVEIEKSADLSVLARCAGISLNNLKLLNPQLRQFATPPDGSYSLRIPYGKKETFVAAFNSLDVNQRFAPQYQVYVVKRGENLSYISKKFRVSIHNIASVNKIRNYHRLQIGQKLTIPVSSSAGDVMASTASSRGQNPTTYIVRKGDTLGHIAMRYATSARRIRQLNRLRYGDYIFPGQKLAVPVGSSQLAAGTRAGFAKEVYTVRLGDTLGHIAERYRVPLSKMRRWNNIRNSDFILPGQKLVIYVRQG